MKSLQERPDPLNRRSTAILVFAVAGRIGSGASFVKNALIEELKSFGYTVIPIKVTSMFLSDDVWEGFRSETISLDPVEDEVEKIATQLGIALDDMSEAAQRIFSLQRKGNQVRAKHGRNILAARCLDFIAHHMSENKALENEKIRVAYIIDSLKHPDEIDLLRTVFREAFCMVGVVADDSIRKRRLREQKQITNREFEVISEIDADEKVDFGQHTTDAILESDYFFENNFDTPEKINSVCRRLLNLLFQSSIVTPRQDEYGMHLAVMAADKSACLSRQVGAAIISDAGTVLSTGCNDVPQFGGGLYTSESKKDYRCFANSLMCHNDVEKQIMADEIIKVLRSEGITGISDAQYEDIKRILLKKTRLRLLIEFSRAVHAEMDSIIAVARGAIPGIVGSTMYVTTYPCHNCAKHIIDVGIKRVVFIEPYVKSLAQKLHSDAINNPLEEPSPHKVSFDNYGGLSPMRYADFFSMHGPRKSDSKIIRKSLRKDELLPLGAQSSAALESRLVQFASWYDGLRSGELKHTPSHTPSNGPAGPLVVGL